MDKDSNIVITGAAGFIGSCLVSFLNTEGYNKLILVDDFSQTDKDVNLKGKKFLKKIERELFFEWLQKEQPKIEFVYHIGARTDTTEFDYSIHEHLNVAYSQKMWRYCCENNIPLVYASSAATYGAGELGYNDDESIIEKLKPLNPYGISKNEFDKWALRPAQDDKLRRAQDDKLRQVQDDSLPESKSPPAWAGLKFFNVYGPNEYHKARMASVIFHSYNQIIKNGFVKLFKSHKPEFNDGEQLRDFIYVKDVLKICFWFLKCWQKDHKLFISGIYNVGTGKARSFNDLVKATFSAMDLKPDIRYIDMPEDIRNTYQYYTQAEMQKIKAAGYTEKMFSLEEGVDDYIRNYLSKNQYY
ncbi:ADP-glyceromanno-heptose 6-epimerase [Ginsengibacter hankyongi]|uniref:ADP-L-glycero-D-manno-heptose-6-epimerase n=1 Tax=Ginsengibacter hankyongi TaxID=2607284 RepID=A0A5J5IG76_9BACT|nr:ADP-glyceromanno-heptose 6-epimerase [Ginsengibacter hankyongi]KAA9039165.1 ADP-glyceromanno-heptose 6-epimerase [Ginsengibacter hankyongi]